MPHETNRDPGTLYARPLAVPASARAAAALAAKNKCLADSNNSQRQKSDQRASAPVTPTPVVQIGAASALCRVGAVPPQAISVSQRRQRTAAMPRSRIEIYWRTPATAPDGVIAQVLVTDDNGSDYLLPYPCELTKEGWVNAASGKPLTVRVTYWKPYVETLPRKKPGKRT